MPMLYRVQSSQLPHLRLRLLQPVRHAHLAVHRGRGREVPPGLIELARLPAQLAEVEVAVSREGAHPDRISEVPRLREVSLRDGKLGRRGAGDQAEHTEAFGLVRS